MSNYFEDFEQQIELEKSSLLRTEHEIQIDTIHERQLAEKEHEIEQLNDELKITISVCNENTDLKQLISELEAEIERLQKRVLEFIDVNIANRKLIGELAEWMDRVPRGINRREDLLQRAREASK
jgi:hypothetical protein